jgi:hypothetical protein
MHTAVSWRQALKEGKLYTPVTSSIAHITCGASASWMWYSKRHKVLQRKSPIFLNLAKASLFLLLTAGLNLPTSCPQPPSPYAVYHVIQQSQVFFLYPLPRSTLYPPGQKHGHHLKPVRNENFRHICVSPGTRLGAQASLIPASLVLAFLPILLIQHYNNMKNKLVQIEFAEGFHCLRQSSIKGKEKAWQPMYTMKSCLIPITQPWALHAETRDWE